MVVQVVGIVSGTSQKTGNQFRMIHYLQEINPNFGSGFEGKSIFVPNNISLQGIQPGDNCDLQFVPGYNGKASLADIKKVKDSK